MWRMPGGIPFSGMVLRLGAFIRLCRGLTLEFFDLAEGSLYVGDLAQESLA